MSLPPGFRSPALQQFTRYMLWPLPFFRAGRARFGVPFSARFPHYGDFVFLGDPEEIEQVFRGDPEVLLSGAANAFLAETLGEHSVLVLDGAEHKCNRRPQMPAYHGDRMRAYADTMRDATLARLAAWREGRPLDLLEELGEITLQVILRAVLGAADNHDGRLLAGQVRAYMRGSRSRFALLSPLVPRWIPAWRRILARQAEVDATLHRLIAYRRAQDEEPSRDVLSDLLRMRHEDGTALSDRELRDHLFTALLAGHDTSAVSLGWLIQHLHTNPEALAAVRRELEDVFGDGPVTAEGLERLPYLQAAIVESTRLQPAVSFVVRRTREPVRIGARNYPAGVNLCPTALLVHHDPALYPEPLRFDPARFLNSKPDPNRWFPFGGGNRICLGKAFALFEMRAVAATLLHEIRLELDPASRGRVRRSGVLLAPTSLRARLVLRAHRAQRIFTRA